MTKTLITKETVKKEITRICRENPNTVNPLYSDVTPDMGCVYHKGRGANIQRCLIGQLGWELGLPTPNPDDGAVDTITGEGDIWDNRFTAAAVAYMDAAQKVADSGDDGIPKFWGAITQTEIEKNLPVRADPIPWGQVEL